MQMPPLTPAPTPETKPAFKEGGLKIIKEAKEPKEIEQPVPPPPSVTKLPTILPNLTIPVQNSNNIGIRSTPATSGLPFPLLILNGLPNQSVVNQTAQTQAVPANNQKDGNSNTKTTSTSNPNMQGMIYMSFI